MEFLPSVLPWDRQMISMGWKGRDLVMSRRGVGACLPSRSRVAMVNIMTSRPFQTQGILSVKLNN